MVGGMTGFKDGSHVVAVTGAAGYIGTRLLHLLESQDSISKIVSIDQKIPSGKFQKVETYRMDINQKLDQIFKIHEVDVVVHLAFIVDPVHDEDLMYRVNVGGTRNVFEACEKTGVKRILMASSGTAYGAHAANPQFLKEEDPLRGNEDYPYARDKVLMERLCSEYQSKHPECDVIVFRPCIVMGPHVKNFIARYMQKRVVFSVRGYDPQMQFVHEDDIAEIFYHFVLQGRRGAYNAAPDGVVRLSLAAQKFRRRLLGLPPAVIYPLTEAAWRIRCKSLTEAPAGLLDFIRYPWLIENSKLKKEIGFSYHYTTEQALDAFVRTLNLKG